MDAAHLSWTLKIRPQIVGAVVARVLAGPNRRRWMETPAGRMFVDPLSVTGQSLLRDGAYEPYIESLFRDHIAPGATVLDVGAHEGYFTLLAANLAGPTGFVVAVEPQDRCVSVMMQNIRSNGTPDASNIHIVKAALGDTETSKTLFLRPSLNSGASSLVSHYRWSTKRQETRTTTPQSIMADLGLDRFDFVKIDVEGYEAEVINGLLPLIRAGKVGTIFLDCHDAILAGRGIDPEVLRQSVIDAGMKQVGCGLYRTS
ncbi:MAG TPA: FkbM family methyltransferase [Micropepsaceae bacterium]|nr:FkbM family methyltransferase [Micropepsaceae bacterium]